MRQHTMVFLNEIKLDASLVWFDTYPSMSEGYARGIVQHVVKKPTEDLTPKQLFHVLNTTGVSIPIESPYNKALRPALEFGLLKRDKHNMYSIVKPTIKPRHKFSIGDKVHALNNSRNAFMQTIYTVCKPTERDGVFWYPIVQDYRKGMVYRKADSLEAVS
jgi:hypothetical protein